MKIARILAGLSLLAADGASAQQQVIDQAGPFRHVGSNTVFPEQFGEFSRGRIVRYEDPMGEDISVGYGTSVGGARIALTEYVYPAPQPSVGQSRQGLCREEFDLSAAEIQKHPNAQKLGETAAPTMAGAVPTNGYRATYTFTMDVDGTAQTVRSEIVIYCYVGGNWFVKYRASSLPGTDLNSALNRFITSGPWPGKP